MPILLLKLLKLSTFIFYIEHRPRFTRNITSLVCWHFKNTSNSIPTGLVWHLVPHSNHFGASLWLYQSCTQWQHIRRFVGQPPSLIYDFVVSHTDNHFPAHAGHSVPTFAAWITRLLVKAKVLISHSYFPLGLAATRVQPGSSTQGLANPGK